MCVFHTGYLAHGNIKGEAKGRSKLYKTYTAKRTPVQIFTENNEGSVAPLPQYTVKIGQF